MPLPDVNSGYWARNRALIAIVIVNFVSLAGFGLMFPVFAVHGRAIGATGWTIAGSVAAFSFGQFLSSPIWGRLSDKHGRRPVLIGSLAAGALVYLLHVVATTPGTLILVRFISGLATGSFSVAFAVASDISTRETRTRVMGIVSAGFSLGFIFGPAIGGLTASLARSADAFNLVCTVGSVIAMLAAVITWAILPETRVARATDAGQPRGSLALLAMPGLFAPIAISFFSVAAFAKMESVLTLFAAEVLGLKPVGIGFMFAGMGTISTITQLLLTGRLADAVGERSMLLYSLAILVVGTFVLGMSTTLAGAACALVFTSVGFALINPALSGLVSLSAPADAQGTAMGVMQAASALGRVFGPAIAGFVYDWQGPAAPFFWASAMLALVLVAAPFARLPRKRAAAQNGT